MPRYFRWEGEDGMDLPRKGVIDIPSHPDAKATDPVSEDVLRRLRFRVPVRLIGWKPISADEYQRERRVERVRRRFVLRVACVTIGIAGCSAAAILLPLPVAIWAASAFAALTATAAVPP